MITITNYGRPYPNLIKHCGVSEGVCDCRRRLSIRDILWVSVNKILQERTKTQGEDSRDTPKTGEVPNESMSDRVSSGESGRLTKSFA